MLYLVRKLGESIIINDSIEIKVVEVKGRTVKLGFEFPPNVTILRKEIHDKVVAQNVAAAMGNAESDFDIGDEISRFNDAEDNG